MRGDIMKIEDLISELQSSTERTKLIYDFKSKYTEISDRFGNVIWSGLLRDLEIDELQLDVIPLLLEVE